MPNLLEDLATFAITNGLATKAGTDVFWDFVPEMPDDVVVFSEYAGDPQFDHSADDRNVQVIVRSKSYASAHAKIFAIYKLFDRPGDRILNITADRWGVFYAKQTPFKMQVDSSNRVLFAFNLGVTTYRD